MDIYKPDFRASKLNYGYLYISILFLDIHVELWISIYLSCFWISMLNFGYL